MAATLGYSTNIHPGATLKETLAQIDRHATEVRTRVNSAIGIGAEQPIALGLWLSARALAALREGGDPVAAAGLDAGEPVSSLREWLAARHLDVASFNAFPYGDFHGEVVKKAVYLPHWGDSRRLLHTMDLAELAVQLAQVGQSDIGLSTLPLGWRPALHAASGAAALGVATANLQDAVRRLAALEERTGVCVHLDLEPEPGCYLDRAADVVALFAQLEKTGAHVGCSGALLRKHLRVCHDICHAAVMFEDQADALEAYRRAGIAVGKVQVSAAIECDGSERAFKWLHRFDEPRWLHQTCVLDGAGAVHFFEDLGSAIDEAPDGLWRSHFHVPVFAEELAPQGAVRSTQREILRCLEAIRPEDRVGAYEVETYAWSALPAGVPRGTLAEDIARELLWTREQLLARGVAVSV